MKTTTVLRMASLAAMFSASAWLVSCSGDDGAVGPAGKDGSNGTNGTNGTNGANGVNGVGYNQAISRGNVLLILDGKRPDGVAFKDTIDFRYAPSDLQFSNFYHGNAFSDDDTTSEFSIKRFQSWDGEGDTYYDENDPTGTLHSDAGTALDSKGTLLARYFEISTSYALVEFPAEKKYFEFNMDANYSLFPEDMQGKLVGDGEHFTDSTFTQFTDFIGADGVQKYNITFTCPADGNSTGYDLKITAIADLKLAQVVQNTNTKRFSTSTNANGRTATTTAKKVAKTFMKSMN